MNFQLNQWKCQGSGCENILDDQLQRCSYKRKFCDKCRREKYLESKRMRLEKLREERFEPDVTVQKKSSGHILVSEGYEFFQT